jgi:hypothetical protein
MSPDQYNECIKQLKKAGAAHPRGRVYHVSFRNGDGINVFDVWTTQAAFDAFGKTLIPILNGMGLDPGQPRVMEVHNVIVPPARKAASRKPAKRSTAKKARARKRGKR